jgi:hypothetical protein
MAKKQVIVEDEIIEVISCRFSLDWVMDDRHKINLSEIWGVELHWRCDDWHVVVVTKEETGKDDYPYRTYELSHWVPLPEIRKLVSHPRVTVKKIINYHHSKNFMEEVQKIHHNQLKTNG